jgi:hypothetical protein
LKRDGNGLSGTADGDGAAGHQKRRRRDQDDVEGIRRLIGQEEDTGEYEKTDKRKTRGSSRTDKDPANSRRMARPGDEDATHAMRKGEDDGVKPRVDRRHTSR